MWDVVQEKYRKISAAYYHIAAWLGIALITAALQPPLNPVALAIILML
jgi:hypothetical protein